ncbi:MAG TPA: hypothetical protein ENI87_14215 [bacterium]|nr:hypothetical protein [bacterium]
MRPRPLSTFLLLTMLGGAACSSSRYTRVVSVNPPDASLYINGEKVGSGDKRPHVFDFSKFQRVYLQATHRDYLPRFEWYDEAKLQQMIANNLPIRMTLNERR